jgi:hypothetical protein
MNPIVLPILCTRNALWIPAYAGMTAWESGNNSWESENAKSKEETFALVFPL